ncbi:MAG: electron transfer flavoprotein subunit beta/FixA family protein [Planctomycetes bacterium]|nr:electron transfer flavoprotein subunit beta/FixA family protein [Planctomycetota bacterium]MBT5101995.1 electron transfer flavoprotein subunit beta/FixA family protein [Planctomycetota bacterium]
MDIYVCIKRVADTSEVDIEIDRTGLALTEDDFSYDINEWDNFAVEAALQLKEEHGGKVTALTVGIEDDEEVLRRALAMGCDEALHLSDPCFEGSDAWGIAQILSAALKGKPLDLLLFGTVSADEGAGQTGGFVAGLLDLPMVSLATSLKVNGSIATVSHEVEGGLERVRELDLPAVVTVQTGINEPRYVSIRGIRKVSGIEIPVSGVGDLGLDPSQVGASGARVKLEELFLPPQGQSAQMLEGSDDEIIDKLLDLLQENGGL